MRKLPFSWFRFLFLIFVLLFLPSALAINQSVWPFSLETDQGELTIYQPIPESLQGNVLTARAAVSIQQDVESEPIFGAFWFQANILVDSKQRTYSYQEIKVTKIKITQANSQDEQAIATIIEDELPQQNLQESFDTLQANLKWEQAAAKNDANFDNAPPKIIFTTYPAVLVVLDGEPILTAIEGSDLKRVVNTPMLLIYDPASKKFYLSSGKFWYNAADIHGDWSIDHNPPDYIASIVTDNNNSSTSNLPEEQQPRIIVATEPAELISSDGQPQYTQIENTDLVYMNNTDSDVFVDVASHQYYVLLSGRWFSSKSLAGPWSFVSPDQLPADFAKIPANSPKASVLVSVPNTEDAQNALIQSQIPKTAAIKRSDVTLSVTYNGNPKFKKIRGTKIKYAVNTTIPVLLIDGRYYACDNGVWFVAESASGPWLVADYIPPDVQNIPPDSPVYNVKYVYIYRSTPDVVYVGYTPGYLGLYSLLGTIVFGTGYHYQYWDNGYYYSRPWTYGMNAFYNKRYGWEYGRGWNYAFRSIGNSWHSHWHERGWYGPGEFQYRSVNKKYNFGKQINVGKTSFKVERRFNNNIYKRPDNVQRLTPKSQKVGSPRGLKNQQVFVDRSGKVIRQGKASGKSSKEISGIDKKPTGIKPKGTGTTAIGEKPITIKPVKKGGIDVGGKQPGVKAGEKSFTGIGSKSVSGKTGEITKGTSVKTTGGKSTIKPVKEIKGKTDGNKAITGQYPTKSKQISGAVVKPQIKQTSPTNTKVVTPQVTNQPKMPAKPTNVTKATKTTKAKVLTPKVTNLPKTTNTKSIKSQNKPQINKPVTKSNVVTSRPVRSTSSKQITKLPPPKVSPVHVAPPKSSPTKIHSPTVSPARQAPVQHAPSAVKGTPTGKKPRSDNRNIR